MTNPILHIKSLKEWPCQGGILVRTDGLIGDNIVASTAFRYIFKRHPGKSFTIYNTYNHSFERLKLLADLFQELFADGLIYAIVHKGRKHGPLNTEEEAIFRENYDAWYDCAPFERQFLEMSKSTPMLGPNLQRAWEDEEPDSNCVALFRWSGYHSHYQLRNRPWIEWQEIERFLIKLGAQPLLFGWDDPMPFEDGVIDFRRKLGVYETLLDMAKCSLLISTVTFAPLFCQHYIPCLVLSDPNDISNLTKRWKILPTYELFDASSDYLGQLTIRIQEVLQSAPITLLPAEGY